MDRDETISLNPSQLLLKGSKLMNTDWVIGCVVYTGLDTKLMQNQNIGRQKQSNVEKESNKTVVKMLCFHVIGSVILAIIALQWN
jgi:magnesium-transporting ATPase (P-type)